MALGTGNSSGKIRAEQTSATLRKEVFHTGQVGEGGKQNKAARAGVRDEALPWSQETPG